MDYHLIRTRRKTVGLEITREGELLVRAPMRLPRREIDRILEEKQGWIQTSMARQAQRRANHPEPDEARWRELASLARTYLPGRVDYYSRLMGVQPTAVRFSRARTRFGSCSAKNAITFSLRLMDYPREAVDYVVVHELAHIRHKNHGREFYAFVASVLPEYKQREKLLKE